MIFQAGRAILYQLFLILVLLSFFSIFISKNYTTNDFQKILPARVSLHSGSSMSVNVLKGDWQEFLKEEYHLYVHKAYLDLRKGHKWGSPAVIITSLLRGSNILNQSIECQLKVEGNWIKQKAILKRFTTSWRYEKTGWQYIVIQCPVQGYPPHPTHVILQNLKYEQESVFLPLEMPQTGRAKLVTCVPIVYGDFDSAALVEWFEIQKYFGVSKVSFSVWKVSEENWKVFDYYKKEGLLDFHRIDTPFDVSYKFQTKKLIAPKKPFFLQTLVGIDAIECLMRNYQRTEHIVMMDLDEVMVPLKFKNYHGLLSKFSKYDHLIFPMVDFDVTCNLTFDSEKHFFLRRTYRDHTENSKKTLLVKSIHKTSKCAFFLQHRCVMKLEDEVVDSNSITVSFKDMILRHYRKRFRCSKKSVQHYILDKSLSKYSNYLTPILDKAKSELKINSTNKIV